MTLLDNVIIGLEKQRVGRQERNDRARSFIDKVGRATSLPETTPRSQKSNGTSGRC